MTTQPPPALQVRLSGQREAYFGRLFQQRHVPAGVCAQEQGGCSDSNAATAGLAHIARFVESFGTHEHDLWLVRYFTQPCPDAILAVALSAGVFQ